MPPELTKVLAKARKPDGEEQPESTL